MFLKDKPLDEYKGFGYRLVKAALAKGMEESRDLANALYDNVTCRKIISIRKPRKTKSSSKTLNDPKNNIMRNIQIHLNTEEAYKVNSQYMYAYSVILDCSFDYLYGKTDIMSTDLEVQDVCKKTGLSEDAVNNLVEYHRETSDQDGFSLIKWWSELLYGHPFYLIPTAWMEYANRIVELHDIDKKIEACDKSEKNVPLNDPVFKYLIHGENQKILHIIKRDKEDSIFGAHYKMISCVEEMLDQYAEEWADQQHPEYDEMYYHREINKLKILSDALKKV